MFSDEELELLAEAMEHFYSYIKIELNGKEDRFHKNLQEKIDGILND